MFPSSVPPPLVTTTVPSRSSIQPPRIPPPAKFPISQPPDPVDSLPDENEGDEFVIDNELDFEFHSVHLPQLEVFFKTLLRNKLFFFVNFSPIYFTKIENSLALIANRGKKDVEKNTTEGTSASPSSSVRAKPVRVVKAIKEGRENSSERKTIAGQGSPGEPHVGDKAPARVESEGEKKGEDLEHKLDDQKDKESDAKLPSRPSKVTPLTIPGYEYDYSPLPVGVPSPYMLASSNNPITPPPVFQCSLPPSVVQGALSTTNPFGSPQLFKSSPSAFQPMLSKPEAPTVLSFHPPQISEPILRQTFSPFVDRTPEAINMSLGWGFGFGFGGNNANLKPNDSLVQLCIHALAHHLERKEEEEGVMPKLDGLNEDLLNVVISTFKKISVPALKACFTPALREITSNVLPSFFGPSVS